jgi:hypothetical protein
MVAKIKSIEIDARYVKEADGFHVYAGTFSVKANADKIVAKLNSIDIDTTLK